MSRKGWYDEGAYRELHKDDVLKECARLSAEEHGDARRAIDLLRVAGELAESERSVITKNHLVKASDVLQQGAIKMATTNMPYHSRVVMVALCYSSIHSKDGWIPTSQVYEEYKSFCAKDVKLLTYRRVSDIVGEFEMLGYAYRESSLRLVYDHVVQDRTISRSSYCERFRKCIRDLAEDILIRR